MIGVSIQCRLGNQFFQYAFARALSKRLKTQFFLVEGKEKLILSEYFELEGYSKFLNLLKKIIYKLKNRKLFENLQAIEIQSPFDNLSDNSIYLGYFQSELFFKDIADHISSYIVIKSRYVTTFNKLYRQTFTESKVIAIHIRRGDYLNLDHWWLENLGSDNLSLPISYYEKCLSQIENLNAYKLFFVSDDIEYVKTYFGHYKNAIFGGNDMITDLQILTNAHVCILSNSSFSWWAAYLNKHPNKKIFCPKYWLGFKIEKEYPESIIPNNWIQTEV